MLRRFVSMRGLRKVMTGIDLSMWSTRAITLKTVGPTSAVPNDVGELTGLCDQAHGGVDGKTLTDLSVCKKPQPELLPPSNGVAVLMGQLRDNAAEYEKCFLKRDLEIADYLFVKYAQRRKEHVWTARCGRAWAPQKGIPQEFVGFWLIRQYPSLRGRVRNSKLNGADADLLAAVASEFGVPLEHIECRVVFRYDSGLIDNERKNFCIVHADFVEGVDDNPLDASPDVPADEEAAKRVEGSLIRGVRDFYDGYVQLDLMYGCEYRRVAIVGGSRQCEAERVGQNAGNDGGEPIYRYRDTYLYFHVKYLKDYLTRQAAASGGRVGDELSAGILARSGPDDGKCLETQPNTCVVRPDKKEVSALKTYLRDSATGYAKKFSDDDLARADDLFLKYSTTLRGVAPPADTAGTCAGGSDSEVTGAWNATCPRPWEALKGTPQEFVGFWLKHPYSFRDGRIEISKLNGHDADLAAAIEREFGVPRGHIECRVMFRDELNGHTATDETAHYGDAVTTPDGVGPETYPRADDMNTLDDGANELEKWKIESVVPSSEEQEREDEEEAKERKDEEAQDEEEEAPDKEGRYGLVIGRNYRRVVVVGGAQHMADTGFGDLGSHTYLFFHVKYLKEYLLRQRKSRI